MKDEYYNSHEARLDTIIGDQKTIWVQIKAAKKEHDELQLGETFFTWLCENYGIDLHLENGAISPFYEIVDEQKYLLFLLKFGGT